MTKRTKIIGGSVIALVIVVLAVMVSIVKPKTEADIAIPLPFGFDDASSSLVGSITPIGVKNGITVKKVLFPEGTDAEVLSMDSVYLVTVPDDDLVDDMPLDQAFTLSGSALVNYFGYKYSSVTALAEKANKSSSIFTEKFPGQFFVSAKARAEDAQHGNAIATFEANNSITMAATDTLTGALLSRNSLYFLIVNEASGATLTVRTPAMCGDGDMESSEACDDTNTTDGDGCSAICAIESGFICSGEPSSCHAVVCGDGVIEAGEACDDSDADSGDGCSNVCAIESGYSCTGQPSVCTLDPVCGNGDIEAGETCDDSNTAAADGCSATCAVESGFVCSGEPSSCHAVVCGDGQKEGSEACDDTNTTNGDGCSATCTVESGFACTGSAPSTCAGICGDGLIKGSEACDDGDTSSGDGCSATCTVESGFSCTSEPSSCTTTCGDNICAGTEPYQDIQCPGGGGGMCNNPNYCALDCAVCGNFIIESPVEQCDDGNTNGGDGCSSNCQTEQ